MDGRSVGGDGASSDHDLMGLINQTASADLDQANAARMYDYYLGGSANFAVDRNTAKAALKVSPEIGDYARANRSFLRRAVAHLTEAGIDQFLDLGSGIPTVGNVHEIAHQRNPSALVAYVDIEAVAVLHARQLLGANSRVSVTQADLRDVEGVLGAPGVAGLLDFTRPVAVLASSILPFIPDSDDPASVMAAYRDACVPGSYLAVSHASPVTVTGEQQEEGEAIYRSTSTPVRMRSRDEIATFLPGYELVEPGLVLLADWHRDSGETVSSEITNGYAAVGVLPAGSGG